MGNEKKKFALHKYLLLTVSVLFIFILSKHMLSFAAETKIVTVKKGMAVTKTYDNTKEATIKTENYTLDGVEDGDEVQLAFDSAEYDVETVAAAKVTLQGASLTGKDAAKYTLDLNQVELDGKINKVILTQKDIVWVEPDNWDYDGKYHSLIPHVKVIEGQKMDISTETYDANNNKVSDIAKARPGKYTVKCLTITMVYAYKDNYDYTQLQDARKEYTINGVELKDSMLTEFQDRIAQIGTIVRPQMKIVDGDYTLTNRDYSVSYSGNGTRAGKYTATITGSGKYTGTIKKDFEVYYEVYQRNLLPEPNENGFYKNELALVLPAKTMVGESDTNFSSTFTIRRDAVNQEKTVWVKETAMGKIYTYTFSYSLDSTMPKVKLADFNDSLDCYVDQLIEIEEANMAKVELSVKYMDSAFTLKTLSTTELKPDENGNYYLRIDQALKIPNDAATDWLYYDIKVTDKAGLTNYGLGAMQIGVSVYPLSSIYDKISNAGSLAESNVLSTDESNLVEVLEKYKELKEMPYASEAEKKEIESYITKTQSLLDKINLVKEEIQSVEDVSTSIDMDKATADQFDALKGAYDKANELLASGNLTESEKENLTKDYNTIKRGYDKVSLVVEQLAQLEEQISKLSVEGVTEEQKEELEQLLSDIIYLELNESNHMTEMQKNLLVEKRTLVSKMQEQIQNAENLLIQLDAIETLDQEQLKKADLTLLKQLQNVIAQIELDYKGNLSKNQKEQYLLLKQKIDNSTKQVEENLALIAKTTEDANSILSTVTSNNVNSDRRTQLVTMLANIRTVVHFGQNYLTAEEIEQLNGQQTEIEALITKLDEVQEDLDKIKAMQKVTDDNLKKDDLTKLQQDIAEIEKIQAENNDNLTEAEKEALAQQKAKLQSYVNSIEKVVAIEKEIKELLKKDSLTAQEKKRLQELQNSIKQLSENEKRLLDKSLSNIVDQKVKEFAGTTVKSGDNTNLALYILLFAGAVLTIGRSRKNKKDYL